MASIVEDQVTYDNMVPWPTTPNGTGLSLHRARVDLWGNDAASWLPQPPSPGRPGIKNSYSNVDSANVIGEVGKVTNVTHLPQTINLSRSYSNPVVLAQPASYSGLDPIVVRITNVESHQFDLFVAEPSNLNGLHNVTETVSYLIIEAGSYWLLDGTHLEAATVVTNATVSNSLPSGSWETIQFDSSFSATPVVLSQVQTVDGAAYLSTRQKSTTPNSFQVALEPEENVAVQQAVETVGYLAIDEVIGTWKGMDFRAQTLPPDIFSFFRRLNFGGQTYSAVPSFFASLATYKGSDNAHLRVDNADLDSIDVIIEEDTTRDAETSHGTFESLAYLVIGSQGPFSVVTTPVVDGLSHAFNLGISQTGRIDDLDVTLELVHSAIEDLDIFLEAPDGTVVELVTDLISGGDWLTNTTLDDEAGQSISTGVSPFTRRFQPEGLLQNFRAKEIGGAWTLHVTDDEANGKGGVLLSWSLDVQLATEPAGNLNQDGKLDGTDIDILRANSASSDSMFDLDVNGVVDEADVEYLIFDVVGTAYGDTDLDRDVDIADFIAVETHFDPLAQKAFNGWSHGNFDGDADVDIIDRFKVVRNFAPLGVGSVRTDSHAGVSTIRDSRAVIHTAPISALSSVESISLTLGTEPTDPLAAKRRADNTPRSPATDRVFQQAVDWISQDVSVRSGYAKRRDQLAEDQDQQDH